MCLALEASSFRSLVVHGDGFVEQLFLEISTDKTTGQFLKGYLTHILDDDGTKISVFQEL